MDITQIRAQFPALQRTYQGKPVVYLDGPAGSQIPTQVAQAVSNYMLYNNANEGGVFATSHETEAMVEDALKAAAALFGAENPQCMVFGANMTTLAFSLSRALAHTWRPDDEIIVSGLDHDANVTPWVRAAHDVGATVHTIPIRHDDCTLDQEAYQNLLSDRTKLVAVGLASNAVGTINPIRAMAQQAHAVGAEFMVDAVHYAPHGLIDVHDLGCDYLVASAYKFFGPHVGLLWGREARLKALPAYKVRPAPEALPFRWMTGTPNLEGIAGTLEAIRYIAALSSHQGSLRDRLCDAFEQIRIHEMRLAKRLIAGLSQFKALSIYGILDEAQFHNRVPTVSFTHNTLSPQTIALKLAEHGIFAWAGNHYAVGLSERLGLEPGGMVRVGLLHYNNAEDVARLLSVLGELFASSDGRG